MEEKKGTKVTLITAILFFLVIVIIIGIALVYMGLTEKYNTEKAEMQEQLNELQGQVAELEKENDKIEQETINDLTNKEEKILKIDTGKRANTLEDLYTDVNAVMAKYNQLPNHLRISSIKENSDIYPVGEGNYWVEVDCYAVNLLTEAEYQKMVKDKKILVDDIEYYYKNDNKDDLDLGYGYIISKENDMYYSIEKLDDKYYFKHEVGGVSNYIDYIDKVIPVAISKNTKVNSDERLENVVNQLTDEFLSNSKVTLEKMDGEIIIKIDRR